MRHTQQTDPVEFEFKTKDQVKPQLRKKFTKLFQKCSVAYSFDYTMGQW